MKKTLLLARKGDGAGLAGAEIFRSLQGEGASQGRAVIFIRASLCNLACHWCDTPYTWNWEEKGLAHVDERQYSREAEIVSVEVAQVAERILELANDSPGGCAGQVRRLVLTGGEPLLQAKGWVALLGELRQGGENFAVEVETNATLIPSAELDSLVEQYNCSPKLSGSGQEQARRLVSESLRWLAASPKATWKFVISRAEELAEVEAFVQEYELERGKVWLMPEGRTSLEVIAKRELVAGLALEHGFGFTDRLHLHLYGSGRGV